MELILTKISTFIFSWFCHQDPGKLFQAGGRDLLLCPRCLGLQMGFILAFAGLLLLRKNRMTITNRLSFGIIGGAVLFMGIEWLLGSRLELYETTKTLRLISGSICGAALAPPAILYRDSLRKPVDLHRTELLPIFVILALLTPLLLNWLLLTIDNWGIVTAVLLAGVCLNIGIALHILFLMVQVRLFNRGKNNEVSRNQGG